MSIIQVEAYGIEEAMKALNSTPKKLERAQSRAINRTLQYAQKQLLKAVSKESGISQKALKEYKRVKMRKSTFKNWMNGEFWMGLNPMPGTAASGRASQQDWGVKKGPHPFEGAFYRKVYGSQPKIYFRAHSKRARNNVRYAPGKSNRRDHWNYRSDEFFSGGNRGRFPLHQAGISIEPFGRKAFDAQRGEIRSTFQKRLMHEINWELSK